MIIKQIFEHFVFLSEQHIQLLSFNSPSQGILADIKSSQHHAAVKLGPNPSIFKLVNCLPGEPNAVAFELVSSPGFFLRDYIKSLDIEKKGRDARNFGRFNSESCFIRSEDQNHPGYSMFESLPYTDNFLSHLEPDILRVTDDTNGTHHLFNVHNIGMCMQWL